MTLLIDCFIEGETASKCCSLLSFTFICFEFRKVSFHPPVSGCYSPQSVVLVLASLRKPLVLKLERMNFLDQITMQQKCFQRTSNTQQEASSDVSESHNEIFQQRSTIAALCNTSFVAEYEEDGFSYEQNGGLEEAKPVHQLNISAFQFIRKESEVENDLNFVDDCEIRWEDLIFKEEIGLGSFAWVYRGIRNGSDVAVKVYFGNQCKRIVNGTLHFSIIHAYKVKIRDIKKESVEG
ncbi:uncharacterized protein LOC111909213 [Lactuca sativa]|uniref:Protein kinase domain-containing protein n=1 Tax=Lactuca sativa TaxID=4236 RepID=A0A9R1XR42_LACSA|nr:uncharacterized protein LOC111909213 [Lactuca sativa]XP_042756551.1 uncharacterized protein LOC111909213 [Lactuca sativa]XP_042756554.1 uncharacterized protein LOC111909213 [Lactuca sativa]XP_042756557.1 uncharacterized protein LOC111909213 [Lactuca sativa]XP_042756562.1 uncharacterized protein LOC111909213 [Lactuca sativa]XP_042756564.1 uncharacterized protein LOC111909213 [Lactuca sativa]XP_042756565.1 uncharacterized protein LOC111909213 [Lactuca sativa]XP_042756566.1 uncharacterized p